MFLILMISLIITIAIVYIEWIFIKRGLQKQGSKSITDYVILLGVIFAICLVFNLRPQLVKIEKVENLKLEMFSAKQWLTSNPGYDDRIIPPFYVSGYIINYGDKFDVKYALEMKLKEYSYRYGLKYSSTAYIFSGVNNTIPPISSLNWYDIWPAGSVEIEVWDQWYRIILPIVNPSSQVGVVLGLCKKAAGEYHISYLKGQITDSLNLRLIKFLDDSDKIQVVDSLKLSIQEIKYYEPLLK